MKTKERSVQIQEVIIRESKNLRSGRINNPGSNQVKNTQEVGISWSSSKMKRSLHKWIYRSFTTRCKPLVTLRNKKVRLNFLEKINNKRATGQMNPKWTCTRMMGRRSRETAHDLKHITSSVKHGRGIVMALTLSLQFLYLIHGCSFAACSRTHQQQQQTLRTQHRL